MRSSLAIFMHVRHNPLGRENRRQFLARAPIATVTHAEAFAGTIKENIVVDMQGLFLRNLAACTHGSQCIFRTKRVKTASQWIRRRGWRPAVPNAGGRLPWPPSFFQTFCCLHGGVFHVEKQGSFIAIAWFASVAIRLEFEQTILPRRESKLYTLRNARDQVNCLYMGIGRFDANRTRFQRSEVKGNNLFTRGTGDFRNAQLRKAIYCPNMYHLPKFNCAESLDRGRQIVFGNFTLLADL
jgi:hypothetical protein